MRGKERIKQEVNALQNNNEFGVGQWFVVQCIARREKFAQLNLANQHYQTFLPFFWKTVRHARRTRTVQQALFPGYLFIHLDLNKDRWRSVNGTFGVSRMIMSGERPAIVPNNIVESLMQHMDDKGAVRLDDGLKVGQSIRINTGPMTDLIGELLSLDDNGRVRVLLDIMSGKIVVTLNRESLHPAS
jgi:transcription elongation factor/antiterminator RfaH